MRSGDISIDRDSDVSIRRQITDQVLFLIATGRLRSGEQLPSVRELARRHDIHANTVSQAYGELVDSHWLKRHRGRRLEVRSAEEPLIPREEGLDDLINATILAAREKGYSLQQLEDRVRHRLLVEPPDHVLVVTRTVEMGKLLRSELSESAPFAVETCLLQEFSANRGSAIGALVTCLPGVVPQLAPLMTSGRAILPLKACGADELVSMVRALKNPALVAIVSISPYFLELARGVMAPHIGKRHSLETYCLGEGENKDLTAAGLVFCDALVRERVKARKLIEYRIVSKASAEDIAAAIGDGGLVPRGKTLL